MMDPAPAAQAGPFRAALATGEVVLTEGAVIERLRRDPRIQLHPRAAHAGLVCDDAGRTALSALWRSYLEVARAHGRAMWVLTPTWRASGERLAEARLPSVREVSREAVALLREVCAPYTARGARIAAGGLMGCRGDCYLPGEALDAARAERFHAEQAEALAGEGVDFVLAATLPSASEALGLARAIAATRTPYVVSYVLRSSGRLLDGTPLSEAVARIDDAVAPPPDLHMAGCTHPSALEAALAVEVARAPGLARRVTGIQGNASTKPPEELEGSAVVHADDPERFAQAVASLRRRFGTRVLGGCCGTDERHLEAIARACA